MSTVTVQNVSVTVNECFNRFVMNSMHGVATIYIFMR